MLNTPGEGPTMGDAYERKYAEVERLRAAATLPDPVYTDQYGRVRCVYCRS
jgi:hypothetical protein